MADGTLLKRGDVFRMETGGGGGWGHPFDRDPETVRSDVLGGFVSLKVALKEYGVVLEGKNCTVNTTATEKLRQQNRPKHKMFHRHGYHSTLDTHD
jgi:N-methylhydantoinase B